MFGGLGFQVEIDSTCCHLVQAATPAFRISKGPHWCGMASHQSVSKFCPKHSQTIACGVSLYSPDLSCICWILLCNIRVSLSTLAFHVGVGRLADWNSVASNIYYIYSLWKRDRASQTYLHHGHQAFDSTGLVPRGAH